MRTITYILILLATASICHAAIDWDIYSDETINGGDYGIVNVYSSAKVDIFGSSTYISWLETHNSNTIDLFDGEIATFLLNDFSTFNMTEGIVGGLELSDSSIAHISGGTINSFIYIHDSGSLVHFYGYDFNYIPSGSSGWLSGFWADDSSFTINLRNISFPGNQIELHEIPEPATFFLIGLGFLLFTNKC